MSISLVNNLLANTVNLNLAKNQSSLQSDVTKLSSGLRINTAADDPSGLAIAEELQGQVNGYDQAVSNVQDATNAATVADGALQTTTDILQRIRSLSVEASSDTNTTADKQNLQTEVTQLLQEVNNIAENTNFNGSSLLDGSHAGFQPAVEAFVSITSNAALAAAASTSVSGVSSGLLVASVSGSGSSFQTSTTGAQGVSANGSTGSGTIDGTIELQVINTGTSIAVQETFISSNYGTYGASVATTLLSANVASTTFDNVSITLGNFQTADVGVTSYIKVSQNVPLVSTASTPAFSFQAGATEGDTVQFGIQSTTAASLRISNINLLVSTTTGASLGAEDAIGQIDNALTTLLTERANLGAVTVRLQEDSSNDSVAATNLQASESNIRDVNVSTETTSYTADQILVSVGTSVLLQSNNNAQSVERLFQ
jgi:flagellin-like hook-associated protein FlgL